MVRGSSVYTQFVISGEPEELAQRVALCLSQQQFPLTSSQDAPPSHEALLSVFVTRVLPSRPPVGADLIAIVGAGADMPEAVDGIPVICGATDLELAKELLLEGVKRRVEQLQARCERLTAALELASQVNHDLRSPLGAIRGHAELLLRASPDAQVRRRAEVIIASVDEMAEKLGELSRVTRPLLRQVRGDRQAMPG